MKGIHNTKICFVFTYFYSIVCYNLNLLFFNLQFFLCIFFFFHFALHFRSSCNLVELIFVYFWPFPMLCYLFSFIQLFICRRLYTKIPYLDHSIFIDYPCYIMYSCVIFYCRQKNSFTTYIFIQGLGFTMHYYYFIIIVVVVAIRYTIPYSIRRKNILVYYMQFFIAWKLSDSSSSSSHKVLFN